MSQSSRSAIGAGGGSFYYGKYGFLYKKKAGGGGRRSTKFFAGGGSTTNNATYLYNKYKPGDTGVGAQSTAVRRAKNIRASVCTPDNKCGPFYNTLGKDNNYTRNLGMNNTLSRENYPLYPIYNPSGIQPPTEYS